MIETFKILIEEPEKLKKYIVFLIRFIIIFIFSSLLYTNIFGEYELLDYKKLTFFTDLYNFFISGKILIVALIYLSCKVVIFDIATEIPASLLRGVVNFTTRNKSNFKDSQLIRFVLSSFGILSIDEKSKNVSLGKNYKLFYDILSVYHKKEAKKDIQGIKHSLMNETLHSYFAFAILFFFFMDFHHSSLLTTLVLLGLLLSSISYFGISIIIEFFDINAAELLFGLNLFRQEKFVTSFLKEHFIRIIENEEKSDQLSKKINFKSAEYSLEFYPGKTKISSQMVQRIINRTANDNLAGSIIITDKPLTDTGRRILRKNKNIKVIYANSEKKLRSKLEEYFFEK